VQRSIILSKQDRGEADELVLFFSREVGWLRGVAKNAKKSRIRFAGHLEPFSLVDLILRSRKKDDLVWIDQSEVVNGFLRIRSDIIRVAYAAYFLEMSSIFMGESQPDQALFDFLVHFLETLDAGQPEPLQLLLDEIRLFARLGYAPEFHTCPQCGKEIEPGTEAIFSLEKGGVAHRECVSADAQNLVISPDTLAVVRRGLEVGSEAATRLRIKPRGAHELRNALSAFARYTRGRQINSLIFLEQIIRPT
jgi:DNA repair protein RecO (recombination protein O)